MDDAWADLDIHARGALAFGTRWLAVNVIITDICKDHGIPLWEEPWRTVVPEIAWAWCDDLRTTEHKSAEGRE